MKHPFINISLIPTIRCLSPNNKNLYKPEQTNAIMKIKKSLLVYLSSLLLMPLISAYGYIDLRQGSEQLLQLATDILAPIFQVVLGDYSSSEFFFAKCLLFILLLVVITFILNKAKIFGELRERPATIYIISLVVSILAIRFLPDNSLISGILLPYSALGVAITTFLPLVVYFYFIHNSGFEKFGRRAGWALYGIVFLALWLSQDVNTSSTSDWIYWSALIFVIISLIFDRSIHVYFSLGEIRKVQRNISDEQVVELLNKYHKAKEVYNQSPHPAAKAQMEFLRKRLREEGVGRVD